MSDSTFTYVVAFPDVLMLEDVEAVVVDIDDVVVDHNWEQDGDPGWYAVVRAPSLDGLRRAFVGADLGVEGVVELLPSLPLEQIEQIEVVSSEVISGAFEPRNYGPRSIMWCARCRVAHRRNRHVR